MSHNIVRVQGRRYDLDTVSDAVLESLFEREELDPSTASKIRVQREFRENAVIPLQIMNMSTDNLLTEFGLANISLSEIDPQSIDGIEIANQIALIRMEIKSRSK